MNGKKRDHGHEEKKHPSKDNKHIRQDSNEITDWEKAPRPEREQHKDKDKK